MLVNYKDRGLTTFPEEIIGNKLITNLNLEGNEISYLPVWMTSLTNLKVLYLSNNQLSDISLLAQIPTLEVVHLNNNKIRVLPEDIGNLQRLRRLFLKSNQIESLPVRFFELKELKKLGLSANKLRTLPWQMQHLDALEDLDLSDNQLTRIENMPRSFNQIKIYKNPLTYVEVFAKMIYYDATQTDQIKHLPGEHKLVDLEESKIPPNRFIPEIMRKNWERPASPNY